MQGACADIDFIVSLSCTFLKKFQKKWRQLIEELNFN